MSLGIAYHKRIAITRTCVHCHKAYQAMVHRRLYPSSSCKVQTCKANRRRPLATKGATLVVPTLPPSVTSSAQTLDWNLQNLAVLGTAAALGNLGVKVGERVVKHFKPPLIPAVPRRSWNKGRLKLAASRLAYGQRRAHTFGITSAD